MFVAREPVVGLGVITGVGRHLRQQHPRQRVGDERAELVDVRPGAATRVTGKNEMATGAQISSRLVAKPLRSWTRLDSFNLAR
jgi:hypothetical protein